MPMLGAPQEPSVIMPRIWTNSLARLPAALGASLVLALPGAPLAADKPPVVVELFTSQGCSSCPPANANLIELSKRAGVLPLSFAVTYWDYLGWKDIFDRPEYTDRQVSYEKPLGQAGPFTPQMVVNGASSLVGNDLAEIGRAVDGAKPLAGPSVTLLPGSVSIGAAAPVGASDDVWLVRYDPNLVEVPVTRGENSGVTLPHTHVVHALQLLGTWSGDAVAFNLPPAPDGMKTAILVQGMGGGSILSAATD
jgi:hypothetical protein